VLPASNAYDFPLLIKHLLTNASRAHARQEIVSHPNTRLSYETFERRVHRLAHSLNNCGIEDAMRVGVMDWDSNRYLECFFAVPMMGATLFTINVRLSPAQLLYTINHGAPDLIIVHRDFMPLIDEIKSGFERDITIIPIGDGDGYEAWIGKAADRFDFPDFEEARTATLFYTTGTTGNPKGVSYSHRQLVLHTLGLLVGFGVWPGDAGFHRGDVYMPLTPLFHVHGWGFPYAATMLGVKQVYSGRYEPDSLLRLIADEGVTFSHCVPTILSMLLERPSAAHIDLNRWKVIIGGAALPRGLQDRAAEAGICLHAAYGMSETCPFLTVADLSSDDPQIQAQTGFAGPLIDLRVVTPDMEDVPHDGETIGEVVARAPWLTQAYLDNAQASDALWSGGYLHTGDVGYMREDGSVQITDRLKDVIKTGGEWVSSLALENIASSCNGIEDVAAIGMPHEKWGERPVLLAQAAKGANLEDLRTSVLRAVQSQVDAGALSKWAMPDLLLFVDQLPKTSVGKLDKKQMREDVLKYSDIKS
jgi:fatty-acyl-CoA synthase